MNSTNDLNVMSLKKRIDAHLRQCAPHVRARESAQLLIAAKNRISALENALEYLFSSNCIPEHRQWINSKEDAIQNSIRVLKDDG